ncbi:MAG: hypothetical protein O7G85_13475, partial [Planctomycetota bacterium]|nr:hypothetical protein [Planctomycetota bacterium]
MMTWHWMISTSNLELTREQKWQITTSKDVCKWRGVCAFVASAFLIAGIIALISAYFMGYRSLVSYVILMAFLLILHWLLFFTLRFFLFRPAVLRAIDQFVN